MKIVKFPGAPARTVDNKNRLFLGPAAFTCPSCGTYAEFNFKNAIFRTIEFHCAGDGCGRNFKLTNPAFSSPKTPPVKY